MRYYGNSMTTTIWRLVDWACCRCIWVYCCCCRCILHLQQYSRRLNLFFFSPRLALLLWRLVQHAPCKRYKTLIYQNAQRRSQEASYIMRCSPKFCAISLVCQYEMWTELTGITTEVSGGFWQQGDELLGSISWKRPDCLTRHSNEILQQTHMFH